MRRHRRHPAVQRITRAPTAAAALELIGSELSPSDTTSLLMAAVAQRAQGVTPSEVLTQYRRDRFVAPTELDPIAIARLELVALERLQPVFEPVGLSPLAPFGCHSALGNVSQNRIVSTIRMSEVCADPTNQLALEAAVRRRELLAAEPRSTAEVRLAATARVVRAQRFSGARSSTHFSLLGVVIAGRSTGGHRFEIAALATILDTLAGFVAETVDGAVTVRLSDLDGGYDDVMRAAADRLVEDRTRVEVDAGRTAGRGYYPNVCFKLSVTVGSEEVEVGDGGFVEWTQSLVQSRKERLLIGAVSLERLPGLLV